MATATFYNTSKRKNSTLVPSGGTALSVELKNSTSLLRPVLRLNYSGVPAWSMLQFAGRYYFITDYVSVRQDLWDVQCIVDPLASWKSRVQAVTAFILYDTAANTEIVDNRLATKTSATVSQAYYTLSSSLLTGAWKIAVTCVGSDSTTTYLLTPAQVKNLVNSTDYENWFDGLWQEVTNDNNYINGTKGVIGTNNDSIVNNVGNIVDAASGLQYVTRAIGNITTSILDILTSSVQATIHGLAKFFRRIIATPSATDCIKAATIIPWDTVGDGSQQEITLGEYHTGINALPIYNPIRHSQVYVTIPWQAADWRRNAPYHQIYIYLPFVGVIELSPSDLMGSSTITVYYSVNLVNGALSYKLQASNGNDLGVYSANTGVPYPIGASNISPVSEFTALASGAAAVASAGTSAIAAAGAAAASISAIKPTISSVSGGGGGSTSGLDMRINIWSVFHDTDVAPDSIAASAGTPALAQKTLSSLSGYVQTRGASVSGAMTDEERIMINNLLDGGVYLE